MKFYLLLFLLSSCFMITHAQYVNSKAEGGDDHRALRQDSTYEKFLTLKTVLQQRIDSLRLTGKASASLQQQLDSLENLSIPELKNANHKINKFTHALDGVPSTLILTSPFQNKMDSLSQHRGKNARIDSLSTQVEDKLQRIKKAPDSLQGKMTSKEMALQEIIHKKTSFTDSLSLSMKNPASGQNMNLATDHVDISTPEAIKLPNSGMNTSPVKDGLTNDLSAPTLPTEKLNLSTLQVPEQVSGIGSEVNALEQIPKDKISDLSTTPDLGAVKGDIENVSAAGGKIEAYSGDLKNITTGNAEKVEALPQEAENAALKQEQLKPLGEGIKAAEASKNVLKQYQEAAAKMNEDGARAAVKNLATKELPDYFAGNEEKLQAGVAQLEKLKKKYGSIPDSRYLPKHIPNAMKDKPFIERVVPGINFQFFQLAGFTVTDISPFAMYRVTTRLRTGAGATYRLQFTKNIKPVHAHDAHGFRVMADYALVGGFNLHAEGEWMRIIPYNPATNVRVNDSDKKQWIPGLNVGILKSYKAGKNVNGNFQVLYNFLYHCNGLYPNKINIRFGFEFPLKKKIKKSKEPDTRG